MFNIVMTCRHEDSLTDSGSDSESRRQNQVSSQITKKMMITFVIVIFVIIIFVIILIIIILIFVTRSQLCLPDETPNQDLGGKRSNAKKDEAKPILLLLFVYLTISTEVAQ